MVVTVLGASGFLGQQVVHALLDATDYQVRAFCRSAESLEFGFVEPGRLELVAGSILNPDDVQRALKGADSAIYLIHMMDNNDGDFYLQEAEAARITALVAERTDLQRLVFMGGLGNDNDKLSEHLASRHNTGRILRERLDSVIELRASMIIGDGSVAYDIVRAISNKLPLLMVPRWAITPTQPILVSDVMTYLLAALTVQVTTNQIIEIGGPEQLTYDKLVALYGREHGHRNWVLVVPFVPRWAAILWLKTFMPAKHGRMVRPMVESLNNTMVVRSDTAERIFPTIHPHSIKAALR
jgi:uncharacterized protein YbjT (DUF2867 family)